MYILIDIVLFLILFSYLFDGWYKGLALTGLNIIGYLFSMVISNKIAYKLTEVLAENTKILSFINKHTTEWIKGVKNEYILRLFDGLDIPTFSYTLVDVFGFILLFFIISKAMGRLIKNLNNYVPCDFLDIVDRLVGSLLGMVRGFIAIFILLALFIQLIEVDKNLVLKETINETKFVKALYNNNPIVRLAEKFR